MYALVHRFERFQIITVAAVISEKLEIQNIKIKETNSQRPVRGGIKIDTSNLRKVKYKSVTAKSSVKKRTQQSLQTASTIYQRK